MSKIRLGAEHFLANAVPLFRGGFSTIVIENIEKI